MDFPETLPAAGAALPAAAHALRVNYRPEAPHVATIGDSSGQSVFGEGVAAIPTAGLVALAHGDFGHGRGCPAGYMPEPYDLWLARGAPVVPLAPPPSPTLAR